MCGETSRRPGMRLSAMGCLAQEDGGQGALLGRNEQG